ncbi:hypothetical protein GGI20_000247 [Coemansia sp. BCRC 34301]|nr:hypothetical protein GGI20_000247 [Coemansia sp. BCRC 34301]
MGQAYSHWSNSNQQGRRPAADEGSRQRQRGNARSSGRAAQGSAVRSGGRSDTRYSPYTTGSRTASATTTRASAQAMVQGAQEEEEDAAGAVRSETITVDLESDESPTPEDEEGEIGVEMLHATLVDLAQALDGRGGEAEAEAERRWEREDAAMQDAAHIETFEDGEPLPPPPPPVSVADRGRARVRAGNHLLSRIVSRSVITSIARELERRQPPASLEGEEAARDHAAYVMDFTGRLNLYYHVSVFILSVLEANVNTDNSAPAENPPADYSSSAPSSSPPPPPPPPPAQQRSEPEAIAVDGDDDGVHGLQFRMFLLPGAIDQALAEYASTHAAAEGTTPPVAGLAPRQSGEQRDREEKLRRLRDIARAMHDERRGIQIPVAILGLRMNSELRRSTRTALQRLSEGSSPPATTTAPVPSSGLHDMVRGLRSRLGSIVPGFLAAHDAPESSTIQPAAAVVSPENASEEQQPGLSVFITIQYMQLGNPLMLPMAAYALFPELVADDSAMPPSSSSGNNYDLFMEIANIIGQASSTTVSQDLVDKRLRKYSYHRDACKCPVARLLAEDNDGGVDTAPAEVSLVSADRCPVCLEDFETGDVLRVLECHHGLHMTCGDAWFTKGSNKCPICRSEAVHSDNPAC